MASGTATLVIGLICIGGGILFVIGTLAVLPFGEISNDLWLVVGVALLLIAVPCFVVGGLFLRKYNRDKK